MPADTTFVHKNHNKKRLEKYLRLMERSYVNVGLPGQNSPQAVDSDGNPAGMTVAQLGVIHELGSPARNIPPRSFMGQTQAKNWDSLKKNTKGVSKLVLNLRLHPQRALMLLGNWYEGRIKHQIKNGYYIPLKPATIAKKKSSRPLIDTAQMRNSVTHQVKMRG